MAGIWSTFVLSNTHTSAASSTHITKLCVNSDLVACFRADSFMKERGSSMPEFRRRTRMVARPPIRIEWRLMPACQVCFSWMVTISSWIVACSWSLAFLYFSNWDSRGLFTSRIGSSNTTGAGIYTGVATIYGIIGVPRPSSIFPGDFLFSVVSIAVGIIGPIWIVGNRRGSSTYESLTGAAAIGTGCTILLTIGMLTGDMDSISPGVLRGIAKQIWSKKV